MKRKTTLKSICNTSNRLLLEVSIIRVIIIRQGKIDSKGGGKEMTLIELLKITNDSTPVVVRTRMYGLTGFPLSIIESGKNELLFRNVMQLETQENFLLVIYLKE